MLEAQGISVRRGRRTVLHNIDVALSPGEVVAVCGPNGAGKSTLLSVLAGDLTPAEGTVRIDGAPIDAFDPQSLALQRAVLEQSPSVAAPFLVEELVGFGASCAPISLPSTRPLTQEAMQSAGVSHLADARTDRLSGGEGARAHLARVLAQISAGRLSGGGKYLFLDEPTASLDLSHQITAMRAVRRVANQGGGVLTVLHDLNLAAVFADRIVLLDDGTLVKEGPPEAVFTSGTLSGVYGVGFQVTQESPGSLSITPLYEA